MSTEPDPIRPQILAADMWPCFAPGDANEQRQTFLNICGPAFCNLIDSLLLYDRVVVPTQDFMVLNILVGLIGERGLLGCLESGALRFAKVRGMLAYAGAGGTVHGIVSIYLTPTDSAIREPASLPLDASIEWAYGGLQTTADSALLKARMLEASEEISIGQLVKNSAAETNLDLRTSAIAARFNDQDIANGNLPIDPKDIRFFQSPHLKQEFDDIDCVLDVARMNLEFELARQTDCLDCSTVEPVMDVLRAKEERARRQSQLERFSDLREMTLMPGVGRAIVEKKTSIDDVLRLRGSKTGEEFRQWFHSQGFENPSDVGRELVKLLEHQPWHESAAMRIVRFIVTTCLGAIEPVSGTVVAAADSFLVPHIGRHKAKLFIDQVRRLGKS